MSDKKHYKLLKRAFAVAKQSGISPEEFREAVPAWGFPRLSGCSDADLRAINRRLKRWYVASGNSHSCSQAQLDYMQQLWEHKSRAKSKSSLDSYLKNSFKVAAARVMPKKQCSVVIQSLVKWNNKDE